MSELILPGDILEDSVELEWLRKNGLWITKPYGYYWCKTYERVQRKDRFYNNLRKAANQ